MVDKWQLKDEVKESCSKFVAFVLYGKHFVYFFLILIIENLR